MADPKFEKERLEAFREHLRTASFFTCAACGGMKAKAEAAGAKIWRPGPGDPKPHPRKVPIYAICLECADGPEKDIRRRVTETLVKNGLFDPIPRKV